MKNIILLADNDENYRQTWAKLIRNAGYEVKTEGDAFMIAFPNAATAVRFCVDAQRGLHTHPWAPELTELPRLTDLTLQTGSPIVGGGGTGGGGSTVF